jgi:uncharacterized protein (TIGR00251 family)
VAHGGDSALASDERGTLVRVLVVPNASRTEVVRRHGDAIRVRVTAPAEGGKANRAVARLLADRCGAGVELVTGASSRHKVFLVAARQPADLEACLGLTRPK